MKIKTALRGIIILGICAISGYYLMFGKHGIKHYLALHQETKSEKKIIALLEQEIDVLSKTLDVWKTEEFAKEQMAREELQMGYANESIYLT